MMFLANKQCNKAREPKYRHAELVGIPFFRFHSHLSMERSFLLWYIVVALRTFLSATLSVMSSLPVRP